VGASGQIGVVRVEIPSIRHLVLVEFRERAQARGHLKELPLRLTLNVEQVLFDRGGNRVADRYGRISNDKLRGRDGRAKDDNDDGYKRASQRILLSPARLWLTPRAQRVASARDKGGVGCGRVGATFSCVFDPPAVLVGCAEHAPMLIRNPRPGHLGTSGRR